MIVSGASGPTVGFCAATHGLRSAVRIRQLVPTYTQILRARRKNMTRVQSAVETMRQDPTMQPPPTPEQAAIALPATNTIQLGFTARDTELRRKFVDLGHEDIARILTIKTVMAENLDQFADVFFDYLSHIEEAAPLFKNRVVLEEAKK